MSDQVQARLISILYKLKDGRVPREQMTSATRIVDELGIDSLEMINLFLSIEDEFDIEIQYDGISLSTLESIETLSAFIEVART